MPGPGWYPDPQDAASLRWFDGENWSEYQQPVEPSWPCPALGRSAATRPTTADRRHALGRHGAGPTRTRRPRRTPGSAERRPGRPAPRSPTPHRLGRRRVAAHPRATGGTGRRRGAAPALRRRPAATRAAAGPSSIAAVDHHRRGRGRRRRPDHRRGSAVPGAAPTPSPIRANRSGTPARPSTQAADQPVDHRQPAPRGPSNSSTRCYFAVPANPGAAQQDPTSIPAALRARSCSSTAIRPRSI